MYTLNGWRRHSTAVLGTFREISSAVNISHDKLVISNVSNLEIDELMKRRVGRCTWTDRRDPLAAHNLDDTVLNSVISYVCIEYVAYNTLVLSSLLQAAVTITAVVIHFGDVIMRASYANDI